MSDSKRQLYDHLILSPFCISLFTVDLNVNFNCNFFLAFNASQDFESLIKSPISLVYEIALKLVYNVTFEVISDRGPPHMKIFVTKCTVGTLSATGEGNGKKVCFTYPCLKAMFPPMDLKKPILCFSEILIFL